MPTQNQVVKIYQLKTIGYDELSKQLDNISKKFEAIKKAKLSTAGKLLSASDTDELKKYSQELASLTVKEQELKVQRQQMINDQKAANFQRQESIRKQKEEAQGNKVVAGSYNDIYQQQKKLYALVKNTPTGSPVTFQGQTLQYDQAITKLKQLSKAEQDFRRQFSKDNLLVGEYSSGIIKAFSSMGDVGGGVVKRLSSGFNQLKGQIGAFVVSFVGAQALIAGAQKAFSDTVRLDSLESALRSVSKTEQEFDVNTKFLIDTTRRLGLELLETTASYKNFYASATQAGLSADQSREIFEAAAEASATLKLSQQDTNGVLLAFGQIASKGKVQAEELRGQIGERLPGAFSIAARAIGVSQAELNKMLENGEVIANDFLPKFAAELKRTFGTDSTKNVEGLQASINRLKNRFTELLQENQAGLSNFFSFLINSAGVLIKLLPLLIIGLGLYTAEMFRAYVATQLTTKGTILYNLALAAQKIYVAAANAVLIGYYGSIALANGQITKSILLTRIWNTVVRANPLGIILTLLALTAGAFAVFAKSVSGSTTALAENARKQLALNDIEREANKIASEKIGKINSEIAVIKSSITSADTKRKAIENLIKTDKEFSNVIKGNIIDLKELDRAYQKVTDAIRLQARAQATAKLAAEKKAKFDEISILQENISRQAAIQQKKPRKDAEAFVILEELTSTEKKLLEGGFFGGRFTKAAPSLRIGGESVLLLKEELQPLLDELQALAKERQDTYETYLSYQEEADKDLENVLNKKKDQATNFQVDIKELKELIEALDKELGSFQGTQAEYDKKRAERERLQEKLDKIQGKKTSGRASRLTGDQKDAFKDIDAIRDQQIAEQKIAFQKQEIDESTYLNNILSINQKAIDDKLKLLKGANAEERKQIAELHLDRITEEQATNQKLYDIQAKALKDQLDLQLQQIENTNRDQQDNVNLSPVARAQAQLDADNASLAAKQKYFDELDQLSSRYNFDELQKAKQAAEEQARVVIDAQKQVSLQTLTEIKAASEREIAEIQIRYALRTSAILKNEKKSAEAKAKAIDQLNRIQKVDVLTAELNALTKEVAAKDKLQQESLINNDQYLQAVKEQTAKAAELQQAIEDALVPNAERVKRKFTSFKSLFQSSLRDLFNVEEGSEADAKFGQIISESFSLAQDALNSYFDAEEARIQRSLELQLERIDMDYQTAAARAQSVAETESLEKQYANRKRQAEQEAFNKTKELKKKEAKMALATELANIWSSVWSITPPWVAIALGAVMSALALGRHQLRVSEINSQTFEKGGKVPTKTGGKIKGPSHDKGGVPFNYEAEGGELAIINKKSVADNRVRTITGTNKQIASMINELGGGVSFANGAKVKMFASGGSLGQSLQPPVYTPSSVSSTTVINNATMSNEKLDGIIEALNRNSEETSKRIDRLEVVQVTKTVTQAQEKEVQQRNAGRIA